MSEFSHLLSRPSRLGLAVCAALAFGTTTSLTVNAQETEASEDEYIEEVVATGTRLKGTATAVLQERKNQAFVADILGAEQIARTGDGDAGAALRRVTGLTLVDGKFIYIRGLGERYSSTQLNGMYVPSPDPTRSVVPLDLFPSDIIESLSVQKSFSPDMPAHFGGGNVDIRTKSIPSEFIFRLSAGIGTNTNNFDDGFFYDGGSSDWTGRDDGTRGLPASISSRLNAAQSSAGIEGSLNFPLTLEDRQEMLSDINWDIGPDQVSVDPDTTARATLGNSYETDYGTFGFLSSVFYRNEWNVKDQTIGANMGTVGCSELPDDKVSGTKCFAQSFEGVQTEQAVTWSGMLNLGYEYDNYNKLSLNNVILHDMSDRLRLRDFTDVNETVAGVREFERVDIVYEERRMSSSQLKGEHTFPKLNFATFDWYVGSSRARRYSPGNVDLIFELSIEDGDVVQKQLQNVSATSVNLEWQDLRDVADNWGWAAAYPFTVGSAEIELKAGADFYNKARKATNIPIEVTHRSLDQELSRGDRIDEIFSDERINNPDFYRSSTGQGLFLSGMADGDDYSAAMKLDAYYLMADAFINQKWRVSGGFRYEDFRQVSVPFAAHSNQFSESVEDLVDFTFQEDDFFPALGLTYILDDEMQVRFNISQSAIRPDMRDVSSSFFIDPITQFLVRGSPLLQSSKLDNVDLRWEWYRDGGDNLSVALFYKDIANPIELIELGTVGGAAPNLLTANAEQGELYGVEVDFLQGLNVIGESFDNFFVSGNFTLSDSNVTIGAIDDDEISLFESQVLDALDATSASNIVTNNERRLVGHSEWVVNIQIGWDSDNGEHTATLAYNAFGPRIIVPGTRGNADAEEETFHSLDLTYSYFPDFNSQIRIAVRNIFDEQKEVLQENLPIFRQQEGIDLSVRYTYEF